MLNIEKEFLKDPGDLLIDRFGRIRRFRTAVSNRPAGQEGSLILQRQDVGVGQLITLFGALNRNTARGFEDFIEWSSSDPSKGTLLDLSALRVVDVFGLSVLDALIQCRPRRGSTVDVMIESPAIIQLRRLVSDVGEPARQVA